MATEDDRRQGARLVLISTVYPQLPFGVAIGVAIGSIRGCADSYAEAAPPAPLVILVFLEADENAH